MHEQFAGPECVVVLDVSVGVGTDMNVEQEGFAVLDEPVGIFEVGLAFADGFDLGAAEDDAGLDFVVEEVVEAGAAVEGGVAFAGGNGIAGAGGLAGGGLVFGGDGVAVLAGHGDASLQLNVSIGEVFGEASGRNAGQQTGWRLC